MEKKWASFLLIAIGINHVISVSDLALASQWSDSQVTLESLTQSYSTPEALTRFLREQMTFEEDRELFGRTDYWQSPEEFLSRRKGDCEDYAFFTQSLLERLGFRTFVFSLFGRKGYAHTVTVFKEKGNYHVVNQDRLIRLNAKTLEEIASRMYPDWTWGAVVTQRGHQGRIVREIFKTSVEAQLVASSLIERSA